jgi:histidyl-tRNA synthetase
MLCDRLHPANHSAQALGHGLGVDRCMMCLQAKTEPAEPERPTSRANGDHGAAAAKTSAAAEAAPGVAKPSRHQRSEGKAEVKAEEKACASARRTADNVKDEPAAAAEEQNGKSARRVLPLLKLCL